MKLFLKEKTINIDKIMINLKSWNLLHRKFILLFCSLSFLYVSKRAYYYYYDNWKV